MLLFSSIVTVSLLVIIDSKPDFKPEDLTALTGQKFDYQIGDEEFLSAYSVYKIVQRGHKKLPEWLIFDTNSSMLIGYPETKDVGKYTLKIRAQCIDPKKTVCQDKLSRTFHINVLEPLKSAESRGSNVHPVHGKNEYWLYTNRPKGNIGLYVENVFAKHEHVFTNAPDISVSSSMHGMPLSFLYSNSLHEMLSGISSSHHFQSTVDQTVKELSTETHTSSSLNIIWSAVADSSSRARRNSSLSPISVLPSMWLSEQPLHLNVSPAPTSGSLPMKSSPPVPVCQQDVITYYASILLYSAYNLTFAQEKSVILKWSYFTSKDINLISLTRTKTDIMKQVSDGKFVLTAGPGNVIESLSNSVELTWHLNCGYFDQISDFTKVLQHNIDVGRVSTEIGLNVIAWYVYTNQPLSRRVKREAHNAKRLTATPSFLPVPTTLSTIAVFTSTIPSLLSTSTFLPLNASSIKSISLSSHAIPSSTISYASSFFISEMYTSDYVTALSSPATLSSRLFSDSSFDTESVIFSSVVTSETSGPVGSFSTQFVLPSHFSSSVSFLSDSFSVSSFLSLPLSYSIGTSSILSTSVLSSRPLLSQLTSFSTVDAFISPMSSLSTSVITSFYLDSSTPSVLPYLSTSSVFLSVSTSSSPLLSSYKNSSFSTHGAFSLLSLSSTISSSFPILSSLSSRFEFNSSFIDTALFYTSTYALSTTVSVMPISSFSMTPSSEFGSDSFSISELEYISTVYDTATLFFPVTSSALSTEISSLNFGEKSSVLTSSFNETYFKSSDFSSLVIKSSKLFSASSSVFASSIFMFTTSSKLDLYFNSSSELLGSSILPDFDASTSYIMPSFGTLSSFSSSYSDIFINSLSNSTFQTSSLRVNFSLSSSSLLIFSPISYSEASLTFSSVLSQSKPTSLPSSTPVFSSSSLGPDTTPSETLSSSKMLPSFTPVNSSSFLVPLFTSSDTVTSSKMTLFLSSIYSASDVLSHSKPTLLPSFKQPVFSSSSLGPSITSSETLSSFKMLPSFTPVFSFSSLGPNITSSKTRSSYKILPSFTPVFSFSSLGPNITSSKTRSSYKILPSFTPVFSSSSVGPQITSSKTHSSYKMLPSFTPVTSSSSLVLFLTSSDTVTSSKMTFYLSSIYSASDILESKLSSMRSSMKSSFTLGSMSLTGTSFLGSSDYISPSRSSDFYSSIPVSVSAISMSEIMPSTTISSITLTSGSVWLSSMESSTSTTTVAPDRGPILNRSIDHLEVIVGRFFNYRIPVYTFFDKEDGNTRNLSLNISLTYGKPLPVNTWLFFNATSQTLYGIPMKSDLLGKEIINEFILYATDSQNQAAKDAISITYKYDKSINHKVSLTLNGSYANFLSDRANLIHVAQNVAKFYEDKNMNFITFASVEKSSLVVSWGNNSLFGTVCLKKHIQDLFDKLYDNGSLSSSFVTMFNDFVPLSATLQYLGMCMLPVTSSAPPRKSSMDETKDDMWLEILLPALVAILVIVIIALLLLICCRHRRPKKDIKDSDKPAFLEDRQPIIFPEELEMVDPSLKPKTPLVLPSDYLKETPPAVPPHGHAAPPYAPGTEDRMQFGEGAELLEPLPSDQQQATDPPPYRLPPPYFNPHRVA